jgi:hypothetical protein
VRPFLRPVGALGIRVTSQLVDDQELAQQPSPADLRSYSAPRAAAPFGVGAESPRTPGNIGLSHLAWQVDASRTWGPVDSRRSRRASRRTGLGARPGTVLARARERARPPEAPARHGRDDAQTGEERLRVQVTLATGMPEQVCRDADLGYLDPATVDEATFEADAETLVVPNAGEVLFRLR